MKLLFSSLFFFFAITGSAQHALQQSWETAPILAIPESVLPSAKHNILFVSLIDGNSWDKDGKGGIGKLSLSGKEYDSTWVTGLNAPKGMGIVGEKLYVADYDAVAVIDIATGKIEKRIAVDTAKGLNDITVTNNNIVYVSDSRAGRIWRIENDQPKLYLDSLRGVNGLKAIGSDLFIGAGRQFMKADAAKQLTKIAEVPQGIDGIEPIGNGDFLLTAWVGYVWYVTADGRVATLLETHPQKKNTADIGYDPVKKIMYVPTFNSRTVVAYAVREPD